MKKTLIALMALAGVAAAETVWTYTPASTDKNGTVGSETVAITLQDFTNTPTQAYTYVAGSYHVTTTEFDLATGPDATNSYTLMAYVNFSSLPGEQFLMGTGSGNGGGTGIMVDNGTIKYTQKGHLHTASSITLNANTWYHLAAAYDATTNKVTFIINGEERETIQLTDTYKAAADNKLYIGAGSTNENQDDFNGSIAKFQIVDGVALDAAGVLRVANVPEPTTATLSLLALAGLAARRRRR